MINVFDHLYSKSPKPAKEGKKPRKWDLGGGTKDLADLDRTKDKPQDDREIQADTHVSKTDSFIVCSMKLKEYVCFRK